MVGVHLRMDPLRGAPRHAWFSAPRRATAGGAGASGSPGCRAARSPPSRDQPAARPRRRARPRVAAVCRPAGSRRPRCRRRAALPTRATPTSRPASRPPARGRRPDGFFELGLGRPRVLSAEGREAAASRWYAGDSGSDVRHSAKATARCSTCGYFLPMAGALRATFGVCANEWRPRRAVISLDHGWGRTPRPTSTSPTAVGRRPSSTSSRST